MLINLVFGFDVMDSCLKLLFSLGNAFKKIEFNSFQYKLDWRRGLISGWGGRTIGCVLVSFRYKVCAHKWTFYKGVKA